jgi:hypothetical protein
LSCVECAFDIAAGADRYHFDVVEERDNRSCLLPN